ncbi:MAG: D-alanyl-D-alanine carboxypeptidase/D-alanyl-D-alanine-endopeptidase [Planctomycetota bacterium]|jgi:D-alanyl-D-alanine carboxypeptidase/D-alanyl-D-alanine-endopeptidase (penicillin-binding protein 4)|nr:D-alanyl-D-alanine carboxypeptidase/D-alanyl-D-alanine-endopeptidase [Planctomycetota bacterium]MDP6764032.1 D-alanyl-D-alanine carboxypeptidase/D-alanyl-D-alanine-endopeptidase [Planctomycetota bacterium]MDP6988000.1 D-alanyl-D-alanine carboxypeptidase/D-alanyl-D-alanine-endopeptidase [Planctomycetota bacterium]
MGALGATVAVLGASALAAGVLRAGAPTQAAEPAPTSVEPRAPIAPSGGLGRVVGSGGERERPAPDRRLTARLRAAIEAAVSEAARRGAGRSAMRVSVHVRELSGNPEVAAIDADAPLRPASNMKLVTTAAALVLLGAEATFDTRFESSAPIRAGVLEGDLVLRAGGDPLFDPDTDGAVAHLLAPVTAELARLGIRRVRGSVVLDEGHFPKPGPGPGWPPAGQHWSESCARAAGFSVNAGCLTALVEAASTGGEARVRVEPAGHGLRRRGTVLTSRPRSALDVAVEARPPAVTVRGAIPADVRSWSARFAHPDPVELFGAVLTGELAAAGVRVDHGFTRERGRPPERGLFVLRSPLSAALVPINRDSNNAVADQLFLATGQALTGRGDRAGGARATRVALERLGVESAGLVQVDGSGLSRDNRVTARQITALVEAVTERGGELARAFLDSLAVAGESGTLARRMNDAPTRGRVRAKTGWIAGTSALSGVVETLAEKRLVFSILVDYPDLPGLNTHCWKPMADELCAHLARWDG